MAKAGFVHCPSENEPDVACCFYCLRELEGWEPEDNPWWAPAWSTPLQWLHLFTYLHYCKLEVVTIDFGGKGEH